MASVLPLIFLCCSLLVFQVCLFYFALMVLKYSHLVILFYMASLNHCFLLSINWKLHCKMLCLSSCCSFPAAAFLWFSSSLHLSTRLWLCNHCFFVIFQPSLTYVIPFLLLLVPCCSSATPTFL